MTSEPHQLKRWQKTLLLVLVVLAACFFVAPLLWMIVSSLRPADEIFRYVAPLQWRTFVPAQLTADHYLDLFGSPFARALFNSLLVAFATVAIGLILTSMAAFALAAMDGIPGRTILFAGIVIAFLVPFDAIAVPMASTFRSWNLSNTYAGLILPGLGNGLAIFLLRQFFLNVPIELRDAARVDGAGWWRIYALVYVPLARPAMIGAGLILFIFQWQSYLWPLIITTDRAMDVAPVALARLFGQYEVIWGQIFAGSVVLGVLPAVLLLLFQRHFAQSVSMSGLKD
jgi:putative chitobiose transport system permease protein